mmetsp:Transcript_16819/g.35141  ORF Transcript_16819/g.35141 Transcript_16819/m.35141 type:complete len:367 (-) Transcript_16819:399-1499(-)
MSPQESPVNDTVTEMTMTEEFITRAKLKLNESSSGQFFKTNDAKLLPSFDRGGDESNEITTGVKLGEGAFCDVREIISIALKRENKSEVDEEDDDKIDYILPRHKRKSSTSGEGEDLNETDEADFPVNLFKTKSEIRSYMSKVYFREDEEGKHARYALKQLKPNEKQAHVEQGLIDLSNEAQFLSCLDHPNIIKMRGVVGTSLTPNFGIILDRLYMTLEDKMDFWVNERNEAARAGMCGCLGLGKIDKVTSDAIMFNVTTIAYDLSCAMRYIHSKNLVYRDTKPENAGFDVRGDIKIFDFGFCKELHTSLFDKPSGLYKLTRMTGSYPYLSPENFLGKPYGRSSDVYSFAVLLWEMFHHKFAVRIE